MKFFIPFSKRDKTKSVDDVYSYTDLPNAFRAQVSHILKQSIGNGHSSYSGNGEGRSDPSLWQYITTSLAEEHGLVHLPICPAYIEPNPRIDTLSYLLTAPTGQTLDVIEICFRYIELIISGWSNQSKHYARIDMTAEDAIERLNWRFQEHSLGYRYVDRQIVRFDSEFVHQETVVPALQLLHTPGFEGPKTEFLRAHDKYKKGDYRGAIVDAENAFESTMKSICDVRRWRYPATATAGNLIEILFKNGLIPEHFDDNKQGLRSMFAGVAVVRNKSTAAHGAGSTPVDVPAHIASYCLSLTAANIVFMVACHKNK